MARLGLNATFQRFQRIMASSHILEYILYLYQSSIN